MELGGWAVEKAIGQGTRDALVEEDEHEGEADTFVGQVVGITMTVTLQ